MVLGLHAYPHGELACLPARPAGGMTIMDFKPSRLDRSILLDYATGHRLRIA